MTSNFEPLPIETFWAILKPKLTSRKFLSTVAAFAVGILASVGVLDLETSARIGAQVSPLLYILVEGFLDARALP